MLNIVLMFQKKVKYLIFYFKTRRLFYRKGIKYFKSNKEKVKKYCKYHNVFGHWTNNCIRFEHLIQKTISDRRLKFKEKPMKVDFDPFVAQANYLELVQILMVDAILEDHIQLVLILMVDVVPEIDEQKSSSSNDNL